MRVRHGCSFTVIVVLPLCLLCSVTHLARADERASRMYSIGPQPVSSALKQFAAQSHMQIIFSPSDVGDATSPGAKGTLSAGDALSAILRGTNLDFELTPNHVIVVRKKTSIPRQVQGPSQPPRTASQDRKDPSQFHIGAPENSDAPSQPQAPTGHKISRSKHVAPSKANTSPTLDQIVVTGTHIRGEKPVGVQTVMITHAQIEHSGYQTTEDLLQSLPMVFRGGAAGGTADAGGNLFGRGANIGYNATGASSIDLRGLGFTSTLVLVDGHRVASSAVGYLNADISTIPLWAIDHIDVLTDGASAIYGSDAVAGVVNIVLNSGAEGVRLGIRDGFATEGGDHSTAYDAQLGHQWSSGGVTIDAEFSKNGSVDVGQRSFSSSIHGPTDIFPSIGQTALTGEFNQGVGRNLNIEADAEYSATSRDYMNNQGSAGVVSLDSIHRWSGSVAANYQLTSSWTLRAEESAARGNELTPGYLLQSGVASQLEDLLDDTEKFSQQDLSASGRLLSLPAGPISLAVGASHRSEDYAHIQPYPTTAPSYRAGRSIASGYAEVIVPIFGYTNSMPGARRLVLSVAGRYDHYSDFGGTINPKYGISWSPISDLELRGAYSTSYRAPATGFELLDSQLGTTDVLLFPIPGPTGGQTIPVVFAEGAVPGLKPETARNTTVGFNYRPSHLPGLQVSANYYDINYSGQLANTPFEFNALSDPALAYAITKYPTGVALAAYVADAVQHGAQYVDATGGNFGSNPLATAVYLYDLRTRNLAETRTSGFDIELHYPVRFGNELVGIFLSGTHIDKFRVRLSPAAPSLSEVNTVGFPASLRLRAQAVWVHGALNIATAANYTGGYPDTSSAIPRSVGPYTTIDLVGTYDLSALYPAVTNRTKITVSITNLFNEDPPYVAQGSVYVSGSHYDAANANPLDRLVTVSLSKQW